MKVIYAFQFLNGTDVEDGWTPLHRVYNAVWERAGGILQSEGEGFSNEQTFGGSSVISKSNYKRESHN